EGGLFLLPAGGPPHEAAGPGTHRQHQLSGRHTSLDGARALLRLQSRRHHADASLIQGLRPGDHGELGGPRRNPLRGYRRTRQADDREHPRGAWRNARRNRRRGGVFSNSVEFRDRANPGYRWWIEPKIKGNRGGRGLVPEVNSGGQPPGRGTVWVPDESSFPAFPRSNEWRTL